MEVVTVEVVEVEVVVVLVVLVEVVEVDVVVVVEVVEVVVPQTPLTQPLGEAQIPAYPWRLAYNSNSVLLINNLYPTDAASIPHAAPASNP